MRNINYIIIIIINYNNNNQTRRILQAAQLFNVLYITDQIW